MKISKVLTSVFCIVALLGTCTLFATASTKTNPKPLMVGTFDSRAIAIAYAHSSIHNDILKEKMAEHKKAKQAGDTEKVKELEDWGQTQQDKLHQQGFGVASVKTLLEHIKKDIPKVAKENGVDIIINKWDMVYQDKNARFVDVTEMIIRGFNPPGKALRSIRSLKKRKPFLGEVIDSHKH